MPRDVLRSLRRLDDLPRLGAALGYTPAWCELPPGCFRGVGAAAIVARHGEFEWYALEGSLDAAVRMARGLVARGLPAAVFGLASEQRRLVIAAADAAPLELSLDQPDPLALARLERCAARPGELALALAFRIAEAIAGRGIDERFFAGFRQTLHALMAALPGRVPLADRHALALLQLTRILFLYFVEAKGWLGRPRFLREAVDRCLSERRSLQRDLLNPLFFGTLNRPFPLRSRLAQRFGPLPFLNGGLFEPHRLERRWRARVTFPTPVLRDAFDSLFERYHFTLAATNAESIAPDMLGRVFEGVMEPGERHATGSYYTPAALVDRLLGEAFAVWLERRARIPAGEAARRLADPDLETRQQLREVRLLDPAVGSGAFLLGALQLMTGPDRAPGIRRSARLRAVLGACLFGVDRNAAAVRLAELRLWLEVVAADPSERPAHVAPLPNLDALVRQGDSLVDPGAGLPLLLPTHARAAELGRVRARVVRATGSDKRAALAALARTERELADAALRRALETAEAAMLELVERARAPTLFGERRGLSAQDVALLGSLRERRRRGREQLRALARTGEVPWFHYGTHFADVLAGSRGGFDLVVGNPPWVRAEALEPEQRRYLRERFRWFRSAGGRLRGYRHLPDLALAFLERAVELAAPDGVVAMLLPAKLATTTYATAAREELTRTATLALAADLRGEPRGFDATVYPMALVLRRGAPAGDHAVRLGFEAGAPSLPQRELGGPPWVLAGGPVRSALQRLTRDFPPLAEYFRCHLGVKTGLNRVFLDPPAGIEPELVRWAVRGRDVRPFAVRRVRRILWPCGPAGAPLDALPENAARHFAAHAGALRRRADHHGGRAWALFRTGPASAPHRVVWADVARALTAAPLTGAGARDTVPLNTCYVMPVPDSGSALRLTAWLNSTWSRACALASADPASGGFARFNARVVAALPCPKEVLTDPALLELARLGVARRISQDALDARCAELLGLAGDEPAALAALARDRSRPAR